MNVEKMLAYSRISNGKRESRTYSIDQLRRILPAFRGVRIAVVGDVMLDSFLWGDATRISPEAPVPVVLLERETVCLGGVGNVAANARALGAEVAIFSVIGQDRAGEQLRELLTDQGINTNSVLVDSARITTTKQRVLAQNKHVVRIDRESTEPVSAKSSDQLLAALAAYADHVDAVLISDYAKGVVDGTFVQAVVNIFEPYGTPVCLDPKKLSGIRPGVHVLKPNLKELQLLTGMPVACDEEIAAAAIRTIDQFACRHLLVTCGQRGMMLFDESGDRIEIRGTSQQVSDVTGAGDTAFSAMGVALGARAPLDAAVILANLAASIAVTLPGTTTVTLADLTKVLTPEVSRHVTAGV